MREALEKARELGLPYLILDGKIVASDRCTEKKASRKGREIDRWYSGRAHAPGGDWASIRAPGTHCCALCATRANAASL